MNFSTLRAVDYVPIGHDSIDVNKETAATGKFFAARIERLDGDRGRLDATD
jgi:hypothetical protein